MIDEKILIEELKKGKRLVQKYKEYTAEDAYNHILTLIYEQPKVGEWIPCSKRFPNKDEYLKNDGRFIVTDGNRVYQSIYDIYSSHSFRTLTLFDFGSRSNFEVDNCVIAWMPLPEPYKMEVENDE